MLAANYLATWLEKMRRHTRDYHQSANERVAIACTREIEHNSEQTNIVITVWPVANAVVTFKLEGNSSKFIVEHRADRIGVLPILAAVAGTAEPEALSADNLDLLQRRRTGNHGAAADIVIAKTPPSRNTVSMHRQVDWKVRHFTSQLDALAAAPTLLSAARRDAISGSDNSTSPTDEPRVDNVDTK